MCIVFQFKICTFLYGKCNTYIFYIFDGNVISEQKWLKKWNKPQVLLQMIENIETKFDIVVQMLTELKQTPSVLQMVGKIETNTESVLQMVGKIDTNLDGVTVTLRKRFSVSFVHHLDDTDDTAFTVGDRDTE